MLDDTLPVTLQYQLRTKLLEKIEGRIWTPGSNIPSERELCDEYGVSRITVREVLKDLVQEGYLVRKQGKGTFVSTPKFEHELTSTYSLSKELEKEEIDSYFKLISFRQREVNEFLQGIFGLTAADRVYEIIRLRYIGDDLLAWEKASIPCSVMEGVEEKDLENDGLYPTIFRLSGLIAEEAEVEVEAVNCPNEVSDLLRLKKNEAVFRLTRMTTAQNRYIEYCESYISSEKYKYKYKQTLRKKSYYDR